MKPEQVLIAIGIAGLILGLVQAVITYETLQLLQEQSGGIA